MRTTMRMSVSLAGALALMAQTSAQAATPASLRDLVGVRGSAGESAIESRGFDYISTSTTDDAKISYWWNDKTRDCIMVTTSDGVYSAISSVSASDCGKTAGRNSNSAGVAVAVGAAALIGALALSHKSHDHDS